MVPLRLTLKNFMCYRSDAPELDLEGLHVACLCGDNGHGKTALFDAMTWALWGKSRAPTQDELVHQGERDMAVELDFSARGQRHRVIRKYSRSARSRQGSSILELQVSSGNGYMPITENSILETQNHIIRLLHMKYDTFVNTAFLLQGKADMFTAAKPAERKEVLAEVLDLAYYEKLEERAKQRGRVIQEDIRGVDSRTEVRRAEVARRPEHEEALAAVSLKLEGLKARLDAARERHRQLTDAVTALRARVSELNGLERRISGAEAEIAELDRRTQEHRGRIDETEALIGREPEVRDGFERLTRVRSEVERLQAAALAAADLEKETARLSGAIAVEQTRLTGGRERVRSRIEDELEPRANRRAGIEAELADIAENQSALSGLESDVERQRGEVRKLGEERDALNGTLEARREIEARRASVERGVAVQETQLKAQVEHQSKRIAELKQAAHTIGTIERQLRGLAEEEVRLDAEADEIDARRREIEGMDGRMVYLRQANKDLFAEMEDTRRNFDILNEDEAQCPVCKHPLGHDGKRHLRAEYEKQGMDQKRRYSENDAALKQIESQHKQLSVRVSRRESSRAESARRATRKRAALESRLHEAGKAKEELVTAEAWRGELETGSFAHGEKARLRLIEQELAGVEYDPERRRETQRLLDGIQKKVEAAQSELNSSRSRLETRKAVLDADLESANRASEELGPRRRDLEEMDRLISTGAFALEEREQIDALQARLEELGYDADEHLAAQDTARELDPYDELSRRLDEAKAALPRERAALASDTKMLERRRSEVETDRKRREGLRVEAASMPARERELSEAGTARDSLEEQAREADVEQRRLRQELGRLDRLQSEIRGMEAERRDLADQKSIYDELAVAFGRNGIQALMIENAIPQLQDDANELLGRLTENRMFLKLQVKEGRRSGGVPSEELDIRISDEVGTRSYETFSGGEAFRINFALRIALSKLLARRSGAPLPILFIDEGFGSQDSAGQERLKEAIQSIQDDFEKIIVITHVEQIKESFPVRIEVTKTEGASTFAVV